MTELSPINAPRGSLFVAVLACAWAVMGTLLTVMHPASDWQATVGVLMVTQAFCGALTWQRFRATRAAALPDFLTIYLFSQFTSKTITSLGIFFAANVTGDGRVAERMLQSEQVPLAYQFQAEIVFLVATVVFTLAWLRLERGSILAVWQVPAPRVLWWTYGLALGIHLALSASGQGGKLGMTEELARLFAIGAIAILLGGNTRFALGRFDCWLPIAALLPLYVLALRSGMKGEVALVSLPILLPVFRRLSARGALLLVSFLVFVVLFVFPFSQAWRENNWAANRDAGIVEVAAQVSGQWARDGFLETAAASTADWLSRGASSQQGGLVMQIVEADGFLGPVLLEGLTTIFIPRSLWPGKPEYKPGAWFTWYLGHAPSPDEATTATAMLLPTELYWMFGAAGVVGGMAVLAVLYWACWRMLWYRAASGVIPAVALFAILARSSGLEGIHTIYALSSPVILVVYAIVFDKVQKVLWPTWTGAAGTQRGAG
jgi:hypothetical protein